MYLNICMAKLVAESGIFGECFGVAWRGMAWLGKMELARDQSLASRNGSEYALFFFTSHVNKHTHT